MEFFNSLNLKQIKGGTKLKQGDLGSVLSYSLTDENGQEITSFDNKTAYINLVLDDKIWFTTTTLVDISRVTFRIDKAIPIGLYYLEIKIDDYIFPSDRDSIILIEEGSTPYDLKELVPNYDVNMTLKGILSDLSQKGIDISDLNRRIGNANAELIASRNGKPNLKTRIDDLENKTTAQLAEKVNKDEVTNVMTPKGNIAYASLPMTGNSVGWYYYCPDGDGAHGAGNYVWNGASWFFGGTGDEGYNLLKKDLVDFKSNIIKNEYHKFTKDETFLTRNVGYINASGALTENETWQTLSFTTSSSFDLYVNNGEQTYFSIAIFNGDISSSNFVKRYRLSENNLPTNENPLSIKKGQTVAFSVYNNNTFKWWFYTNAIDNGFTFSEKAKLNDTQIEQVLTKVHTHSNIVRYLSGNFEDESNEKLEIFLPTKKGYIKYNFVHSYKESIKCDSWRLSDIYHCDELLSNINKITRTGEYECALKINGAPDFMGGYLHGDEVLQVIKIFIDGKETEIDTISELTSFNELRIIETSLLYNPSNEEVCVAKHGKEYIFKDSKVIVKQSVRWLQDLTLETCYLAMFPVMKDASTTMIENTSFEMTELSGDNTSKTFAKATYAECYSQSKNVSCKFEVIKYPDNVALQVRDNGGNPYNKMYFDINIGTVKANDLWQSETMYEVTCY